jgi:hypothetical protein
VNAEKMHPMTGGVKTRIVVISWNRHGFDISLLNSMMLLAALNPVERTDDKRTPVPMFFLQSNVSFRIENDMVDIPRETRDSRVEGGKHEPSMIMFSIVFSRKKKFIF